MQPDFLLELVDRGYNAKSWHGPNLKGSLRRVDLAIAAWRPQRERHNIWEIVLHAAYWKYVARRRLLGEKRGSFPLKGSNWFIRPVDATGAAWKTDVALLDDVHRSLRMAIEGLDSRFLRRRPAGSKVTNLELITGVAYHDVYHAGQIQLLKVQARSINIH